jgi:hypothetical protein
MAYAAVKSYVFATGKACKQSVNSGTYKKVVCTTTGCSFEIVLFQQKAKDDRTWRVAPKSVVWDHMNCTSHAQPSARLLAGLTTLRSAVEGNRRVSARSLGTIVQASAETEFKTENMIERLQ